MWQATGEKQVKGKKSEYQKRTQMENKFRSLLVITQNFQRGF